MADSSERPGAWVENVGWVAQASDLPVGTTIANHLGGETTTIGRWSRGLISPVVVIRWTDGTEPARPSAPPAPERWVCPEHPDTCIGPDCCCADLHRPAAPPTPDS